MALSTKNVFKFNHAFKRQTNNIMANLSLSINGATECDVSIRVIKNDRIILIKYTDHNIVSPQIYLNFSQIEETSEDAMDTLVLKSMDGDLYRFRFPSEGAKAFFIDWITLTSSDSGNSE